MVADGAAQTRLATGPLHLVKTRLGPDVRAQFLSVRLTDSWNSVPGEVRMARNVGHFKRRTVHTNNIGATF
jgi:hypothetical protein